MQSSVTVEQLENQLAANKKLVETRTAAQRLYANADFQNLIVKGFMLNDAARYAQSSGDPALPAAERADALAMAQASGHLKRFLSVQIQMANVAERDIPNIEQAIDEARAEANA